MKEKAEEFLRTMGQNNGNKIDAEMVVQAARDPSSPLHEYFPWDDAEAAHQHRLDIARKLIRGVRMEVITVVKTFDRIPKYLRDPELDQKTQGYISLREASPTSQQEILFNELENIAAYVNRTQRIASVGMPSLKKPLETLLKLIRAIQAKVKRGAGKKAMQARPGLPS